MQNVNWAKSVLSALRLEKLALRFQRVLILTPGVEIRENINQVLFLANLRDWVSSSVLDLKFERPPHK